MYFPQLPAETPLLVTASYIRHRETENTVACLICVSLFSPDLSRIGRIILTLRVCWIMAFVTSIHISLVSVYHMAEPVSEGAKKHNLPEGRGNKYRGTVIPAYCSLFSSSERMCLFIVIYWNMMKVYRHFLISNLSFQWPARLQGLSGLYLVYICFKK